jgi:hypothetical protein
VGSEEQLQLEGILLEKVKRPRRQCVHEARVTPQMASSIDQGTSAQLPLQGVLDLRVKVRAALLDISRHYSSFAYHVERELTSEEMSFFFTTYSPMYQALLSQGFVEPTGTEYALKSDCIYEFKSFPDPEGGHMYTFEYQRPISIMDGKRVASRKPQSTPAQILDFPSRQQAL